MSDDLIDRARAALDGATPGVWHVEGKPWKLIVWSSWSNRVCVMAHSNGFNNKADLANAHFIAAARQLVPEMADEIARLRAEVDRLEEAERTAWERWRDDMAGEISSAVDEITARIAREDPEGVKVVPLSALVDFFAEIVAGIRALTPEASHD